MIEIPTFSDAGRHLASLVEDKATYLIRIQERQGGVAIKRNEGMWTPTLSTETRFTQEEIDLYN